MLEKSLQDFIDNLLEHLWQYDNLTMNCLISSIEYAAWKASNFPSEEEENA